jgi:hypothetical protein
MTPKASEPKTPKFDADFTDLRRIFDHKSADPCQLREIT